jgi:hypothetical protein
MNACRQTHQILIDHRIRLPARVVFFCFAAYDQIIQNQRSTLDDQATGTMEEEPWDESEPGALPNIGISVAPSLASAQNKAYAGPMKRTPMDGSTPFSEYDVADEYIGNSDPGASYDEDYYGETTESEITNPQDIREEALKILELADSPTRSSRSSLFVHRTSTGGFSVGAPNETTTRRAPAALSGSLFTTNRTNSASSYRDDVNKRHSWQVPSSDELEYGDDDIVAAIAKVNRSEAFSGSASNSWSSRYSLDRTLAGMTATNPNTKQFLDKIDRGSTNRTSATGLSASSAYDQNVTSNGIGNSKPFGSGFSFRQNNVWGKQGVTVEPNTNLYDAGDQLPDQPIRKSWQEQMRQRKRQRRNIILAVVGMLVFVVSVSTAVAKRKKAKAMASDIPLTIFITSDSPYTFPEHKQLAHDLGTIQMKADFLVHLGNIQNVTVSQCALAQYSEVSGMLQESKIPTFMVPGENDWVNCPDQQVGFERWANTFVRFAHKSGPKMEIDYQQHRMENFAFQQKGVLFLGIHVVGGRPTTYSEFTSRMSDNVAWIQAMYNLYAAETNGVVVFGNAAPGLLQLQDFFDTMASFLGPTGKPILYVHANSGSGGVDIHKPFIDYSNIVTIQAPIGGKQPPLPIIIGSGKHLFSIGGLDVPYRA